MHVFFHHQFADLKWVLMHFPNSSCEGNFKRSPWLYVMRSREFSICELWKSSISKLCNYALNSSEAFSKSCVFPAVSVIYSVQIRFFQFFLFSTGFVNIATDVWWGFVNFMKINNYFGIIYAVVPFWRQKFSSKHNENFMLKLILYKVI